MLHTLRQEGGVRRPQNNAAYSKCRLCGGDNIGHYFTALLIFPGRIGRSRMRLPHARYTALAIAAEAGPCTASPAPSGSSFGRFNTVTSTSGTSLKRNIG